MKKQSETKNFQKVNKELQEVMRQIKEALLLNPDFIPQGKAVARLNKEARQAKAAASAFIKEKTAIQAAEMAEANSEKK